MLRLLNIRATQQRAGTDTRRDQRDGVIAQALQRTRQQSVRHRVTRQQIKGVFVLHYLRLIARHAGSRLLVNRHRLANVRSRRHADLLLTLHYPERAGGALHRRFCQRQVAVIGRQGHPGGGQFADHRQARVLRGKFTGKPGFTCCARQALVAAKQIQLEAGDRAVGLIAGRDTACQRAAAGVAQLRVHRREQGRSRFAVLGARGVNIGNRFLQVAVAVERHRHYAFQARIVHHLLPLAHHGGGFAVRTRQRRRNGRSRALIRGI